jgi:hypothetical protein
VKIFINERLVGRLNGIKDEYVDESMDEGKVGRKGE